jgi:polysaccharide biosynthesis/export protein
MRRFCEILGLVVTAGLIFFCAGGASLLAQQRENPQSAQPRTRPVQEQQTSEQPTPQAPAEARNDYILGPEDVLRIDVFQVPELSNLTVRVANDGTITVPLLGRLNAAGLTSAQLAHTLQSKWGENYLQNPIVTVFVQEFHAKPVSVVGSVERPGLYYLTGPRTLVEMLSMAGGLAKRSSGAAGPTVYVTRQQGFGNLQPVPGMQFVAPDKVAIDIRKLLYSNETALNIPIHPLDIISVNKADIVYVTGRGVQKPGGFVLEDRDNVTVFQALAMAAGLGPNAAKHDARIIRQKADGSRVEIPVDLDKVLKGQAPDPVLAANDILFVPDSAQKAGLKHAIDMTVATLSGLLIYGRL